MYFFKYNFSTVFTIIYYDTPLYAVVILPVNKTKLLLISEKIHFYHFIIIFLFLD